MSKHSCSSEANSPEHSITVTIPYDRQSDEVYEQDAAAISPVDIHGAPVNVQDKIENVQGIGLKRHYSE